jgi:hypothetical protein
MMENAIRNFSRPKIALNGKMFICSPPSSLELEALDKHI